MARQKPFRFVHTADLHLDSPLRSLAMLDSELRSLIDGATRRTLSRLVDLCIHEAVDALIIAGDLYDGSQKSMKTAAVFAAEMRRLEREDIPVFLIKGNHDAASELTRDLQLPGNVHLFDGRGTPFNIDDIAVIHGVSFAKAQCQDSLYPKYRPPVANRYNIGIMHTSLAGSGSHDNYAPCALENLKSHGYDYWALGHIHKRQVHANHPAIVMPGIPQGRYIGEDGPRSVTLVTLDSDKPPRLETHAVHTAEFHRVPVTLNSDMDWSAILEAIDYSLLQARKRCDVEHLIARPILEGQSSLYFELIDGQEQLLKELRYRCESHQNIWIEKIRNSVTAPLPENRSDTDDVPIHQLISEHVLQSAELEQVVDAEFTALKNLLPAYDKAFIGTSLEDQQKWLDEVLKEGAEAVLARLQVERTHAS